MEEPPPGGKQCQHILDPYGRHAPCCTKGLHTPRHDRIRDLITKLARQAGLTATTEQAMLIPDQLQEDGQLAPGSVHPIHTADVHIIEPQGSELWLDVKFTQSTLTQFGRTAPGAQAIFNRIMNHRLQVPVRQGIPFSFATRTASSELWGPISCTLLRAAWQAHAECAPRIGQADLGDTPSSLPNSPGESQ